MSSNLEPVDSSDKGETSMPFNLGSQQLVSTNKQYTQADLFPRFHPMIPIMPLNVRPQQMPSSDGNLAHGRVHASTSISNGSCQLAYTNKELVQAGIQHNIQAPMVSYMGFQQPSSTNSFQLEKGSSLNVQNMLPVNVGGQLTTSRKRPAQRERQPKHPTSMPSNLGSQVLSTQKRPSQMEPPLKVQTESFETVRSKLRESLAAALSMSSNQKNKLQLQVKNTPKETQSTEGQPELYKEEVKLCLPIPNPSVCESTSEILTTKNHAMKGDEGQDIPSDAGPYNDKEVRKHDAPEDHPKPVDLEDEVQFSRNTIINDELLQEYGLCWASEVEAENSEMIMNQEPKRPRLEHQELTEGSKLVPEDVTGGTENTPNHVPESLATKIESELFRLFGGVNKKYKEKGRSLLFNLKDRSNPELRERVLSGDIAPERLCSMTAEELASKELSEWRLAKAEEFAQMVVLPDSEVDIRRLVRKTHKGEFQVEVEQDDSVSVEVAIGTDALTYIPTKVNEEAPTQSKSNESQVTIESQEIKASEESLLPDKANSGEQLPNLDNLLSEKADFMQDFMVDELKDTKCLPPIVSLDEFMEALDSEPPFENLSIETVQDTTHATEKNTEEPEVKTEAESLVHKSDSTSTNLISKLETSQDDLGSMLNPSETVSEGSGLAAVAINTRETEDNTKVNVLSALQSTSVHDEANTFLSDDKSSGENIWEGLVQLNISAVSTVVGYFRSGEKTPTQEWPKFLEIKGRVRVDAFEKFLQELPHSRSRAIMVMQFCWKEGSDENGRLSLCETIDSYVIDERVGFAEPVSGVELYFCPPHPKTMEMLGRHLPKDHINMLQANLNGLIGVVVWRRPHVTTVSPRLPKHGSSKKVHFSTSRQQQNIANSKSTSDRSSMPTPSRPPTNSPEFHPGEEPIDDIPPGFGPAAGADKDDLPEFDFAHNRPKSTAQVSVTQTHDLLPPAARPVEQIRELIQKYGQGESARKPGNNIQPWNDDDDIPEWQPHQQPQPQPQQLPPPPPPLPQQSHNYMQQILQQPFLVGAQHMGQVPPPYQLMPLQSHAQQQQQQQQLFMPPAAPLHMHQQQQQLLQQHVQHQMGLVPGQQNVPLAQWLPPPPAWGPAVDGSSIGVGVPMSGLMQPCNVSGQPSDAQFYGMPPPLAAAQIGMGWRPDVPRGGSRGV